MKELKVGDFVTMKIIKKVTAADEVWEITEMKWPCVMIRNVADHRDNPKTPSQVFDVSLLRKVL